MVIVLNDLMRELGRADSRNHIFNIQTPLNAKPFAGTGSSEGKGYR